MLKEGLVATARTIVTSENTALKMGSGDLEVFATPAMVALMEQAAMLAVADVLEEGCTTVGTEMNCSHIKASKMGAEIAATAVLTRIEGRKLIFTVGATDEQGIIGEGTHTRFVVDRVRFMAKL